MNYKLAASNLLISQFLITLFLAFGYFVWFPHSLSAFIDFEVNARLIIFVNIIIGPFLFLILLKKNKSPKSDLFILLCLQLLAFTYGAYTLYQKHPNYAVFAVDRFTLINSSNSNPDKIQYKELETNLFSKTKLVFAKFPEDKKERNSLILSAMANPNNDLDKRHEYFEPYHKHIDSVIKKSIDTKLLFSSKESKKELNNFLEKYKGDMTDYIYIPLQSANKDVVWVLDRKTATPLDILNIDPWLQ